MGTGIGIVASRVAGLNVVFVDPSEASLKKSEKAVASWCDKEVAKERMTESAKQDVISRISYGD
jgi:3-hydroxybutyryl-CoA dehydrogenase|tara:strand:+ start:85 stop:276 length:192 start_codon:yes stop_codon:yes gene_type:complete